MATTTNFKPTAPVLVASSEPLEPSSITRTFRHLVAGSTTTFPDGRVVSFAGEQGKTGVYETNDPKEIEHLIGMTKSRVSQTIEITDTPEAKPYIDPTIAAAAKDAAANTLLETVDTVSAVRNAIAAGKVIS